MDKILEEKLNNIENLIKRPFENEGEIITRQVPFEYNVPALGGVDLKEACPITGFITEVTMHFPEGCNSLVDIVFGHRDVHLSPHTGYISLNNATPSWRNLHESVKKGETLWTKFKNGDLVNSHAVAVIVTLLGVE